MPTATLRPATDPDVYDRLVHFGDYRYVACFGGGPDCTPPPGTPPPAPLGPDRLFDAAEAADTTAEWCARQLLTRDAMVLLAYGGRRALRRRITELRNIAIACWVEGYARFAATDPCSPNPAGPR